MSIPTGFQHNYTNPETGLTINNAWLDIACTQLLPENFMCISVNVYVSESDKNDGLNPVDSFQKKISSNFPDFATYFSLTELNKVDNNIVTNSINYLQAIL